jgi:hypothetical protein
MATFASEQVRTAVPWRSDQSIRRIKNDAKPHLSDHLLQRIKYFKNILPPSPSFFGETVRNLAAEKVATGA